MKTELPKSQQDWVIAIIAATVGLLAGLTTIKFLERTFS